MKEKRHERGNFLNSRKTKKEEVKEKVRMEKELNEEVENKS